MSLYSCGYDRANAQFDYSHFNEEILDTETLTLTDSLLKSIEHILTIDTITLTDSILNLPMKVITNFLSVMDCPYILLNECDDATQWTAIYPGTYFDSGAIGESTAIYKTGGKAITLLADDNLGGYFNEGVWTVGFSYDLSAILGVNNTVYGQLETYPVSGYIRFWIYWDGREDFPSLGDSGIDVYIGTGLSSYLGYNIPKSELVAGWNYIFCAFQHNSVLHIKNTLHCVSLI